MSGLKQFSIGFLVLLGLMSLCWHLLRTAPLVSFNEKDLFAQMDMMVKDLRVQRFGPNGSLVHSLEVPLLRHSPSTQTYLFSSPFLQFYASNQPPWEIKAQEAEAKNEMKEIFFRHNVLIHQAASLKKNTEESSLKMETLSYYPDKHLALSEDAIHFEQPGRLVLSKGMRAYLAEKKIQLLSHMQAIYFPEPYKKQATLRIPPAKGVPAKAA